MAADVTGQLAADPIPSAITAFRLGLQSSALAEVIEHAIRFEFEQVLGVQILRVLERTAGKAHGGKRQGPGDVWHGWSD